MLTVQGKVLGQSKAAFEGWAIPLPCGVDRDGAITLRELLEYVVEQEVESYHRKQEERRLLKVLTKEGIAQAAQRGAVKMGGENVNSHEVEGKAAILSVMQAFEDGLYLVFLDGAEQKSLDQEVYFQPESELMFVRLTLLSGG